jgi:Asp-tRNA(Asn)/Glu-tRNA(Gln) amidotransferase C subunit
MIKDLQSQLKFVQAIQQVDTEGVEPLQSIRDETKEAEMENEITVKTLQEDFDKEEVVGRRGRIKRRTDVPTTATNETMKDWNPLAQAPKKRGRLFVVDTAKD